MKHIVREKKKMIQTHNDAKKYKLETDIIQSNTSTTMQSLSISKCTATKYDNMIQRLLYTSLLIKTMRKNTN